MADRSQHVLGVSMESNVACSNNPLAGQSGTCLNGAGARYRAIGTSEEVKSVLNSSAKYFDGLDGIGFTFFSYGNVSSIANSASYGYITLNNVDPIFASYGPQSSTGAGYDPGQPWLPPVPCRPRQTCPTATCGWSIPLPRKTKSGPADSPSRTSAMALTPLGPSCDW